jgi:acetylornithine/succinyldiaminopimelate/putrescine aminotransferase
MKEVKEKEQILVDQLTHPAIIHRNHKGLWMSLQFDSDIFAKKLAATCVQNGIITDWFLFAEDRIRIAPPLCITNAELTETIKVILKSIDQVLAH